MRIQFLLARLFLSLATIMFLTSCGSELPTDEQEVVAAVRPAKLLVVGKANNNDFLNYPAVIKSQALSVLSFEVGGMLDELLVVEAQAVQKGDVLAKLDQRDLQAQLTSARSQFNNLETEYQRAVRLIKEDAISRSVLEQRKSKRDVSQSQLETAQKALQNSVLIAPYEGAIAKVSISKREIIQAGKPAITILGKGGLEATINLPSSFMANARKQQGETNSYIVLDAAPDQRIPVVFKEAALEADAVSQTYEVIVAFEAPVGLNILPGMNAVVWFKDPSKPMDSSNNVSIPLTAIAIDGTQKYVWLVENDSMTVSKRNIVVANDAGSTMDVISGLKAGDKIVSAGVAALSEGMKVSAWSK